MIKIDVFNFAVEDLENKEMKEFMRENTKIDIQIEKRNEESASRKQKIKLSLKKDEMAELI